MMTNKLDAHELRGFVESIELLLGDRMELNEQLNNLFDALKEKNYDAKVVRQLIRMRKLNQKQLLQQHDLMGDYIDALGMREHCKGVI